ncbi:transposase [Streptomyces sp. JJ66]|nr:transposase [Streptomyces sp. JJ66]
MVIDDTQAQKKGTKSVGVAFQHCGLTGDVRNCQTDHGDAHLRHSGRARLHRPAVVLARGVDGRARAVP